MGCMLAQMAAVANRPFSAKKTCAQKDGEIEARARSIGAHGDCRLVLSFQSLRARDGRAIRPGGSSRWRLPDAFDTGKEEARDRATLLQRDSRGSRQVRHRHARGG